MGKMGFFHYHLGVLLPSLIIISSLIRYWLSMESFWQSF